MISPDDFIKEMQAVNRKIIEVKKKFRQLKVIIFILNVIVAALLIFIFYTYMFKVC